MIKSSNEPVISFFKNSYFRSITAQFSSGNSIVFNLSIGYIVSYIFWLMNVYLPKLERKREYRKSLESDYLRFKRTILSILLQSVLASNPDDDIAFNDPDCILEGPLPEEILIEPSNFHDFFYKNGSENWYAVLNSLNVNDFIIKDLYVEFELLNNKVEPFVYEYGNRNSIKKYRRYSDFLHRLKHNSNLKRPDNPARYIGDFLLEILDVRLNYDLIIAISSE